MLKRVFHDVFDIANRIKEVDKNYQIFFNVASGNFELFFKKGFKKPEFCLNLGKKLDARAIKLAESTQTKFSQKIFRDILDTNQKIEDENNRILTDFSTDNLGAFFDYAQRKGGDVSFEGANTFRWM